MRLTRLFRLGENRLAAFGALVVLVLALVALFQDVISPYSPTQTNTDALLQGPSLAHPLGTDELGRDVLSRIIHGSRIALLVSISAITIGIAIGVTLGMAAAYLRGLFDGAIMRSMDLLLSFPAILLALTVMAALGAGLTSASIAIGIIFIPIFARIARASTMVVQEQQFIEAAHSTGMSRFRILGSEILPNILPPLIVQATVALSFGILAEASLSFLGLGAKPPTPSWGQMLFQGRPFMAQAPWTVLAPGAAIFVAVLAFNLLGDGLRDELDPRLKSLEVEVAT
jgi:peptide/nickel transport system permease protein